jgi:putative addiction module CopG family antidote
MEVHLTPDQEAFIQQHVSTGRFATADEAVQEAIMLLEERERQRVKTRPSGRKSLAQLFAESPFKGLDMEFPRGKDPLRSVEL